MTRLVLGLFSAAILSAAALVPLQEPKFTAPFPGLEPNRGQSAAEVHFLARGAVGIAVTPTAILHPARGVRQAFVASQPNPALRYLDPLPGLANFYSGADPAKWITGVPRYATAQYTNIYPGIDAQYTVSPTGAVTLRFLLAPGADPQTIRFDFATAVQIYTGADAGLYVKFDTSRLETPLSFAAPTVSQPGATVRYDVLSNTRYSFRVDGHNNALPLVIEMPFAVQGSFSPSASATALAPDGSTYAATTIYAPTGPACGTAILTKVPCTDAAVYHLKPTGELLFATYLTGSTNDEAAFAGVSPTGEVIVTGATDSADFPITAGALQPTYAGPAPNPLAGFQRNAAGDLFAARLDPSTGRLLSSTFFGGPGADASGDTAIGSDGSIYLLHKPLVRRSALLPVSSNALQPTCASDPCTEGYVARIGPALDRVLFATFLPGTNIAAAKVFADGSVSFAGANRIGRLDSTGTRLLFSIPIAGPGFIQIPRLALAPDSSVWASVTTFQKCCNNGVTRLLHYDSKGERMLAELPLAVYDFTVDREGNLIAIAANSFVATSTSFLKTGCRSTSASYFRLNPEGRPLFVTYLPSDIAYEFAGTSPRGLPLVQSGTMRYEIVEAEEAAIVAGCLTDAASYSTLDLLTPGGIVSLFGTGLGPVDGIAFQLQNGRLPDTLSGTRILVNGRPAPLLYAAFNQVNFVLPFDLALPSQPVIQVERGGVRSNALGGFFAVPSGLTLFSTANDVYRPAAALNEDGTVNSVANPARAGSRVVLFGTGGGATMPASSAGEVSPLAPRPLLAVPDIILSQTQSLPVEYAGSAPGLLAGVVQVNVKLPDSLPRIPEFFQIAQQVGALPIYVRAQAPEVSGRYVTIAVRTVP